VRLAVIILGLIAFSGSALSKEIPPFTMKFELTLQTYGKCLREAVDRYDLATTSDRDAAEGAIGACVSSYQAAETQLADDFVTRQGYSRKSAKSAAARNMQSPKPRMTKTALEFAQGKRSGKNAAD
jgi:hypothetical protein